MFVDSDRGPVWARLPAWRTVLAVVAHPDDESFGLGAILDAFHRVETGTAVLCLTRGEASTMHGVAGDLTAVRGREFAAAARRLGVTDTVLRDFPDGALDRVCRSRLSGEVIDAARALRANGLLVFDPSGVTGHPDHAAATAAALLAAAGLDLPVLGWTLPARVADKLNGELGTGFVGHRAAEIGIELPVDRSAQTAACAAHVSQAIPTSVLWRRLELLGDTEHLRWLPNPPAAPELTHKGRRVSKDVLRDELTSAAARAGLGQVTPHQLRHTFATALVTSGVSLQSLMAMLGHVSAEMSLRYGRLFDTSVRAEYERALTQAKAQLGAMPPPTPTRRRSLPLLPADKDWREAPGVKARLAGGYCVRAPAQGASRKSASRPVRVFGTGRPGERC